jgi:hypothetical protein
MIRYSLVVAFIFAAALNAGAQDRDRRSRRSNPEQSKTERLRRVSQHLNRLSSRPELTQENRFIHEQVSSLLDRSRQAPAGSYLFDRLHSAMEDLLNASEHILDSRQTGNDRDGNTEAAKRRIARDLERTYFRIQQGDYFASQSQERNAAEYVLTARRLYQLARVAYDQASHFQARRLADASREVISSLESLAQAAMPNAEPPKLPEG